MKPMKASHLQGINSANKSAAGLAVQAEAMTAAAMTPSKFSTPVENEMRVKRNIGVYAASILLESF